VTILRPPRRVAQVVAPIEQMKVENDKIIIAMSRHQLIEQPPVDD
jgi:hypothetical protein